MSFSIPPKGVGLQDYTSVIERTTSPTMSPILRQRGLNAPLAGWVSVPAFPLMYRFLIEMPQGDGTTDFPASTVNVHWSRVEVRASSNCLLRIELLRYASLGDAFAGIIDTVYPGVYGYGEAIVEYSAGIKTEPGYCYGERMGVWSANAFEYITLNSIALVTDLTPAWMGWGHRT